MSTGPWIGFCAVYTTWWVEAEVYNGGFNQYFWNSSRQFANEAVAGFELIGAPKHAALMTRAIDSFRQEEDRLQSFIDRDNVKAFSESYQDTPLNSLDEEFYELSEDLSRLRIQFIRRNPDLFVGE